MFVTDNEEIQIEARYYADANCEYGRFWDDYQQGGTRSHYNFAFAGYGWTDVNYAPKYPLDTGIISGANNVFNMSSVSKIGCISLENATQCGTTFANAAQLKTIEGIAFPNNYDVAINTMFNGCSNLENIEVLNTIRNTVNFASCPLKSSSIESVLGALSTEVTGKTATFKKTAVDVAFETSDGAKDGSISAAWLSLMANKPDGWEITLS